MFPCAITFWNTNAWISPCISIHILELMIKMWWQEKDFEMERERELHAYNDWMKEDNYLTKEQLIYIVVWCVMLNGLYYGNVLGTPVAVVWLQWTWFRRNTLQQISWHLAPPSVKIWPQTISMRNSKSFVYFNLDYVKCCCFTCCIEHHLMQLN